MRVTILGCGPSMGVPAVGNQWGACDPENPRNRRTRTSILVETGGKAILVDTGPDLRQQLLAADVRHLDAAIITHDHADHVHGIDELRGLALKPKPPLPIYAVDEVAANLESRFGYLFGKGAYGRAFLTMHTLRMGAPIEALGVRTFEQDHFVCKTLGLRFGPLGYCTDVMRLDETAFESLRGIDTWIVAALRKEPHEAHATVSTVLGWIERIGPRRAILTHMGSTLDYETLRRELPPHVEPAYDGMVIEVDD